MLKRPQTGGGGGEGDWITTVTSGGFQFNSLTQIWNVKWHLEGKRHIMYELHDTKYQDESRLRIPVKTVGKLLFKSVLFTIIQQ